jgi:hypothetical protein
MKTNGMENYVLKPHEIFRHRECQRVSREILARSSRRALVYGPSGAGVSMFVRAHCDIYWNKRGSLIILADDEITTTQIFEENPGLRQGLFRHVYVDLSTPWTKSVINIFFKKIPSQTDVIVVTPELPSGYQELRPIVVNTKCPNSMYEWLSRNRTFFRYFDADPLGFYRSFHQNEGNLSRLMQKSKFGTDTVDFVSNIDPFAIETVEQSDVFFSQNRDFDVTQTGSLQMLAMLTDIRSLCDFHQQHEPDPDNPDEPPMWSIGETLDPLYSYSWWHSLHVSTLLP